MGDFAADARPIVATNAVNADITFMLGMYGVERMNEDTFRHNPSPVWSPSATTKCRIV
jgi:hypothetical protein